MSVPQIAYDSEVFELYDLVVADTIFKVPYSAEVGNAISSLTSLVSAIDTKLDIPIQPPWDDYETELNETKAQAESSITELNSFLSHVTSLKTNLFNVINSVISFVITRHNIPDLNEADPFDHIRLVLSSSLSVDENSQTASIISTLLTASTALISVINSDDTSGYLAIKASSESDIDSSSASLQSTLTTEASYLQPLLTDTSGVVIGQVIKNTIDLAMANAIWNWKLNKENTIETMGSYQLRILVEFATESLNIIIYQEEYEALADSMDAFHELIHDTIPNAGWS